MPNNTNNYLKLSQNYPKTIQDYLQEHENKDMLRFLTCGSVDDGKSTLIGRILYDTKVVFEDQLSEVRNEN